jgi:hypothetical protein
MTSLLERKKQEILHREAITGERQIGARREFNMILLGGRKRKIDEELDHAPILDMVHDGRQFKDVPTALSHFFPALFPKRCNDWRCAGRGSFAEVHRKGNVAWKIGDVNGRIGSFHSLLHFYAAQSDPYGSLTDTREEEDILYSIQELIILREASRLGIAPTFYGAIYMREKDETPDEAELTDQRVAEINAGKIVPRSKAYMENNRYSFNLIIVMQNMDMTLYSFLHKIQTANPNYSLSPKKVECMESAMRKLLNRLHSRLGITCTDMITKNIMLSKTLAKKKEPPFSGDDMRLIDFGGGFCHPRHRHAFDITLFAISLDAFRILNASFAMNQDAKEIIFFREDCKANMGVIESYMTSMKTSERNYGRWEYMLNHYFRRRRPIDQEVYAKWKRGVLSNIG